jgi:hypothetical protein
MASFFEGKSIGMDSRKQVKRRAHGFENQSVS